MYSDLAHRIAVNRAEAGWATSELDLRNIDLVNSHSQFIEEFDQFYSGGLPITLNDCIKEAEQYKIPWNNPIIRIFNGNWYEFMYVRALREDGIESKALRNILAISVGETKGTKISTLQEMVDYATKAQIDFYKPLVETYQTIGIDEDGYACIYYDYDNFGTGMRGCGGQLVLGSSWSW